jgi:hypothetical protein
MNNHVRSAIFFLVFVGLGFTYWLINDWTVRIEFYGYHGGYQVYTEQTSGMVQLGASCIVGCLAGVLTSALLDFAQWCRSRRPILQESR